MKTCFKCGQEKDADEFYRHPKMGDGHLGKCKECTRKDTIENREKKLDYYRAYDRMRGNRITEEGRALYEAKNPEKMAAIRKVNNAVRDGRLEKPEHCTVCGKSDTVIHGHHADYSRPLDVLWCCAACHKAVHKMLKRQALAQ